MSKVQIICIGIMAVCTLIMIASTVWSEYKIRKAYKEMRKLRGEE